MALAMVTDSTADLPNALLMELGVTVVPLMVHINNQDYVDQVTLDSKQFLALLRLADQIPHTSAPAVGAFVDAYRRLLSEGFDEILSVHLSGHLSGTLAAAQAAKKMVDAKIEVVDGRSASLGTGLLVWWGARRARQGIGLGALTQEIVSLSTRSRLVFSPITLEYLARGGRIGQAARWVGTLLDMKPVLVVESGRIQGFKKVRGERQLIPALIQAALATVPLGSPILLGIAHAENVERAEELRRQAERVWEVVGVVTGSVGPVVSTHSGPGAYGMVLCPLTAQEVEAWQVAGTTTERE